MLNLENNLIAQASRAHYLREVHAFKITPQALTQALTKIVQYGVKWGMLDQTILQAIQYFDAYLGRNPHVQ